MSTPQFVDVSGYQGNIDFTAYAAWARQGDGIARIAMKSSEGVGFTDPSFISNRAKAIEAGIDCIYFYHFARPDINSAQNEAQWQKQVVGDLRAQDIVILDYEENTPNATAEWAYEWLAQQELNYGKLPGIYASSAYIAQHLNDPRLARYPLWLANWMYSPDARPPCPPPWTNSWLVQYSNRANIPGIAGVVDANIFLGVEPTMTITAIDLTNPTVASHFTGGPDIWQCKDNGFLVGYGILKFYQQFGCDALCGLTYLGLPRSNEQPAAGYPGVTVQEFERGAVRYDPSHQLDSPPGSGPVYLVHVEQDPRAVALQAQIALLQQQPSAALLQQINSLLAQASTGLAQIETALTQAAKLSQVQ